MECSAWGDPRLLRLSPGTAPNTAGLLGHKPKSFQSLETKIQKEVYMCEIGCSVVCSTFFHLSIRNTCIYFVYDQNKIEISSHY